MSILTDAFRLLDRESNVFSFLPAVNQLYIYWKSSNPTLTQTTIAVSSLLVSVVVFNILTHGNFSRYESDSKTMKTRYALLLVAVAIIWSLFLSNSIIQMYEIFSSGELWPVLLTAISLVFVFLLVTHAILGRVLPMYDSINQ